MPVIDVPQHGLVEFPDSMSNDEIVSAIQSNYPDLNSKPSSVSSVPLSPYEKADYESSQSGKGKAVTGMESGTEFTTTLANNYDKLTHSLIPKGSGTSQLLHNARQFALAEDVSQSTKEDLSPPGEPSKLESIATGVARGALQTGEGLVDFMTSPLGIATMGTGMLPKLGQRAIALAFAADMARQTPEIAQEIGTEFGKPESERDYKKISQLVTAGAVNTGFAAMLGTHGLTAKESFSPIEAKADAIAPLAPLTAEALKQTVKEGGESASQIESAKSLPEHEVRPPVGESAPLRQQPEEPAKPQAVNEPSPPNVQASESKAIIQLDQDIARYQELNAKRNDMLKTGEAMLPDQSNFTPDYFTTWRELEDIKNRHGGMPPTEEMKGGDINGQEEKGQENALGGMGGALYGEEGKPSLAGLTDSLKTLAEQNPSSGTSEAFDLGKKFAALKDEISGAVEGLKSAGEYMKMKLEGKPVVTDFKRALGQRHLELTESVDNANKFAKTAEKAVPDKKTQEAIANYVDTGGDEALLRQAEAETKARYAPGYEAARNLTPEQKIIAKNIKYHFESRLQDAINAGILEGGIEDYIHRIYEKDSPWKTGVLAELRSGVFTGQPSLAKKRVFQYDFEAEKAGYKPIKSFIKRIAAYDLSLNKAIADRKLVKSMMEIKMPDGRPMIDVGGIGMEVPKEGVTEATLIKPSFKPEDTETPANNRADYKAYDYPALRKWKWVAKDANGNPIFVQGDVLIHPEAMKQVKALFERSAIRANPVGRAALGVSSVVKQTMLDLSGFHLTQIAVHGMEHRSFKPVKEIDFQNPDVRGLIKGGLVAGDTRGHEMFREGVSGSSLTRHIPGIGPKLQAFNEWLFNSYIPRLKVATGLHALERNRKRFPNLSDEELYHLTANQMNAAFGQLNYEMIGRSKTTQDMMRLALLAPDFLEARSKFVAQAGTKYGREQFQALMYGAAAMYFTARIMNKLIDGEYHFELKNAFSVVVGKKAYSLRTVQGDLLHLVTEPGKFAYNRLNPVFGRTGFEFLTGRDAFGRKRDLVQQAKDAAGTIVPISLRGLLDPREQSLLESVYNAFGITERRSQPTETINNLVQDFKEKHKIRTDPGEFIYDPDKDPYRAVKQAATFSDIEATAKEIAATIKKGDVTAEQMKKHFTTDRPFTGSKANDTKFFNELSDDNKKIFADAKRERQEVKTKFNQAYQLYLKQKDKK